MGYRWYQSQGIKPLFPFGYGLSYSTFQLSHIEVSGSPSETVTVRVTVTNTGDRDRAKVVQVYAGIPGDGQPPKRLIGFSKVHLAAGGHETLTITIDASATHHPFSVWDDAARDFVVKPGDYASTLAPPAWTKHTSGRLRFSSARAPATRRTPAGSGEQRARPHANRAAPMWSPSATPGGTANNPEPRCCRYSMRASSRERRVCMGTYWVRGSLTKAMKNSPASRRPY